MTAFTDQEFVSGTTITSTWLNGVNDKLKSFVSVKDFGAIGDGSTDDIVAIQAAIDSVYASGGGELFFPEGTYKTSSTIYMKRGVSLVGPRHKVSAGQMYEMNAEATIAGVAKIKPTSAVTVAALAWDYQLSSRSERPYGAVAENIILDCRDQAAGSDGIYVRNTPAGEGPFDDGWASGATRIINVVVLRAPRYGANVVSTSSQKTNASFVECRFAFCGSHGVYAYLCFDILLRDCFSFANAGDGIYLDGCATERVLQCDVFGNTGHGITLDGYNGRYEGNAVELNGKHGYNIIATTTTQTTKRYRLIGGRVETNGTSADNTYDNIFLGQRSGVAISGMFIDGVSFGLGTQSNSNRLRSCIYSEVSPVQIGNFVSCCSFAANDIKTGNTLFNDAFWQHTTFSSCSTTDGNPLTTKPRTLTAWTGSGTPNTLRGASFFKTANVSAAVLSGVANGSANNVIGRELWILIDDVNTGVDFTGSTLKGNGGVDLSAPCQGKLLHLKNYDGTNWAVSIYG